MTQENVENNIQMPDQPPTNSGSVGPKVVPAEGMKVTRERGRTYAEIRKIFLSTPERKSYTMLGLTLIALILVIAFVIRPMLVIISQRKTEITVLKTDSVFLNQRISTVLAIQEDITKYNDELNTFSDYFPANQNTSALTADILTAAEQLGLEVIDISTSRAGFVEDTSSILVPAWTTITVWGTDMDNLIEFMYKLEELATFPTVDTMAVLVDSGLYQANFRVPVYTVNPEFKLFESETR